MSNKYKALMLDLDGTTIPNKVNGMPSERVKEAILQASKKVYVGCVTARPRVWAKEILATLEFTAPCILGGGAQVYDPKTKKIVWDTRIPLDIATEICVILKEKKIPFLYPNRTVSLKTSFRMDFPKNGPLEIAIPDLTQAHIEIITGALEPFKSIAIHKIIGPEGKGFWLQITHAEATKQLGILKVAEILNIETHAFIGVGDSYNDFPLLMACGLKVAMGNAAPELKAIADYIAPTVDEDGVVDVIEKFILKS